MNKEFEFNYSESGPYLVISFYGTLSSSTEAALEGCAVEALKKGAGYVILNCQNVGKVEVGGIPSFIRMQKALRDAKTAIRICGLDKDKMQLLLRHGAIRKGEISPDLHVALSDMQSLHCAS